VCDLNLVLVHIDLVLDCLQLAPDLLSLSFDGNHLLLLALDVLFDLVELVDHRMQLDLYRILIFP
jgi:hypothetical protein